MKIIVKNLLALAVACAAFTSRVDLDQRVADKLNVLNQKTEELDSLLNREVTRVMKLDTLINTEVDRVKKLDSLLNTATGKID